MVHVLVRHKVADYTRWKEAFDSHLTSRKHAGETGCRLFHNVDDPRDLVLLLDWAERRRGAQVYELGRTAPANAGGGSSRRSRDSVP